VNLAEKDLTLEGYNPAVWATTFDYHNHPFDLAPNTVEAVRANTAALIKRLPPETWERDAQHKTNATHLHEHSTSPHAVVPEGTASSGVEAAP
jgi:hypothetical protein